MSVRTEESVPAPGNDLAGVESLFEQARRSLILVPLKEILPLVASPLKKWDKLQELLADNESRFAIEILGKSQDNARIYELTRMYGECFCREGDSAKMKLWSETVPVPKRDRKALLDQLHSFHSKGEDETFSAMITVNKSPKAAAAAKKVKAAITFTFGKDGRLDIRLLAVLSGYRRHGFMSFLLEFVFLAQTARMRKETSFERSNTGVKGPPKTMATIHAILSEKDPSLIFFHAMGFEVETKDLTPVAVDSNAETEVPIGPKDLELSFPPHPKESFKFHRAVLISKFMQSSAIVLPS
jgi:GNAT superfamily N-acetyltransferase